ncbi:alkaline phosphatase family protein [Albibacterium profundi]|uniref:Alkaline phosphatase family protein n=1 Tax=Albibacterium profundi TaxID=3134906 RepID=A0ABV5CKC9_9SPHI
MMMNAKKYRLIGRGAVMLLAVFLTACQQEFEKVIPDRDYGQDTVDVTFGAPKVLYIIVDGARGESVRTAGATNIDALLPSSIYSFVSISDPEVQQTGTNWADMLTGVQKDKHGIVGNDFDDSNLDAFPLITERIKAANEESGTELFTSSALFQSNFSAGVDVSEVLSNDAAVKDAAVASLSSDDATLITAHFTGVDKVGAQFGYDNSVPEYKEAILTFDGYVGELLAALESRESYDEENWLVVIASSEGGYFEIPEDENDNTVFSNPDVNTFVIFYADKYQTRFIGKPFLGSKFQGDFVRFQGQKYAEVTAGDNSIYNLGDEAFTIELKVKKNPGPDNNYKFYYPAVLGKRPEWSSGWASNGWVVFLEDNFWMFNARGTGDGNQVRGGTLADATWNSLTVVGVIRDNERFVRTYTNGVFNNETNVQGWGNFDNDAILRMGYINGSGHGEPDVYISDVRIWKAALPDDVIEQYSCNIGVDEDHPYYDALAGYWPVIGSGDDGIIRDEGPLGSHMTLRGDDFDWDRLSEYICAPSAENLGELVPRNVDIPAQIYSWLRISRQESWQLDGRVWLDR